jgi:hypothetical protein
MALSVEMPPLMAPPHIIQIINEGGIWNNDGRITDREKSNFWQKYKSQCPLLEMHCPRIELGPEL